MMNNSPAFAASQTVRGCKPTPYIARISKKRAISCGLSRRRAPTVTWSTRLARLPSVLLLAYCGALATATPSRVNHPRACIARAGTQNAKFALQ